MLLSAKQVLANVAAVDATKLAKLIDTASDICESADSEHIVHTLAELSNGVLEAVRRFTQPIGGGINFSFPSPVHVLGQDSVRSNPYVAPAILKVDTENKLHIPSTIPIKMMIDPTTDLRVPSTTTLEAIYPTTLPSVKRVNFPIEEK
jgi:hypothetical protein